MVAKRCEAGVADAVGVGVADAVGVGVADAVGVGVGVADAALFAVSLSLGQPKNFNFASQPLPIMHSRATGLLYPSLPREACPANAAQAEWSRA